MKNLIGLNLSKCWCNEMGVVPVLEVKNIVEPIEVAESANFLKKNAMILLIWG